MNHEIIEDSYVLHRRFDRMARLVGEPAMQKLFETHVMVIGLGGVGSWAAESLVRSGVGRITLVDFDEVCITNTNRQLQAMQGCVGKKKAVLLAERLQKINPQVKVEAEVKFYNEETSDELMAKNPDIILDAIDNLTAKAHLLNRCREEDRVVICCGGAGGRLNPMAFVSADLSETHTDQFLAQLRKMLRQKYDFPEMNFGIPTIFSTEFVNEPQALSYDQGKGFRCVCPQGQNNFHSCEKRNVIWGTASFVTGSMGFMAASAVVQKIIGENK